MTTNVRKTRTTGRKSGRMSKAGRSALSTILPLIKLCTESVMDKADVFGREAPLYLEIGFGTGAFLSEKAATAPQHDFIGIEIYVTGISKLLVNLISQEDPDALSITNVRVFNKDARSVLENNIPPDSFDGIYILFPDPWPKKKHHKRKLINPEFAAILFPRLKAQGYIVVATDSDEYATEIESSFASAGFVIEGEDLSDISRTAFALKAAKDNRQFNRYRFVKAGIRLVE
ncbi:MAG: tRNA (guanosine(46)-N7)-methyltransferase TrmB [Thermodesulfovibrionia bacterium]|nr:tRNA (guanosine(46)-N7)-methyltransferase TrmB [Thermodesulfovibrionia bacterium]